MCNPVVVLVSALALAQAPTRRAPLALARLSPLVLTRRDRLALDLVIALAQTSTRLTTLESECSSWALPAGAEAMK